MMGEDCSACAMRWTFDPFGQIFIIMPLWSSDVS